MRGWHRVLLLLLIFEVAGPAQGAITADLPGAPRVRPAPRHETVPKPPGPAYEWIAGRWVWTGQKFEWVKGAFKQRKPRPWRYFHGRFVGHGGAVTWQPGYFAAPNGGQRVARAEEPDAWRRWRRDPPVRR